MTKIYLKRPQYFGPLHSYAIGHRGGVAGIYNRAKYARQIRSALSLWDDHLGSLIEGGKRNVLSFPQQEIA